MCSEIPLNRPPTPLLDTVNSPEDLRQIKADQLEALAAELRQYLLFCVGQTGGHFGAGLGVVELTIALHFIYNTPSDRLVWDVGHQTYPHKILTGRREQMLTMRQHKGLSGFPKRNESHFDTFGVGHSSTSISAALGMAIGDSLAGKDNKHVAIIGDGAMTAGMAFEALNHAAHADEDILVILNDNNMSISPNVGGLATYFSKIWASIITQKGKGFSPAEADPVGYHALNKLEAKISAPEAAKPKKRPKFQDIFGQWLCDMAASDEKLIGITPAMCEGSGMVEFAQQYPERYHDVAIAEQHAVTLAAGIACEGQKPVVAIYSTFLQRAYDQVIHDVALQNLDVTFGIDRAGLVGEDGPTHAGNFDLSFLRCVPNMIIAAPSDENECRQLLYTAYDYSGPAAVRYPRGTGSDVAIEKTMQKLPIGKARTILKGSEVALLNFGTLLPAAKEAATALGISLYDMRWVKPLDTALLEKAASEYKLLVTLEENGIAGGAGSGVSEYLSQQGLITPVLHLGLPDTFIEHGKREKILATLGLDRTGIELAITQRMALLFGETLLAQSPFAAIND